MMKTLSASIWILLLACMTAAPAVGQNSSSAESFKDRFMDSFDYASRVLDLAKAMPADTYAWRPMEEVSSVQEVYTHIARYNFYYLESSFGIATPEDLDLDTMESITGKEDVVALLERSIDHVKEHIGEMPVSRLTARTELYGRPAIGQTVLMQLITHLSEHVGQSIAYARSNNVIPPWNR